jgi:putative peptidoglycan lipid II flippase
MLTIAVCTGMVKSAGAAKVVLSARAFGISDGLDAYLIALLLPTFVADMLGGSLNSSVVPTFIEVRARQGIEAAHRLYQSVIAASGGLLLVVAMVLAGFAPWALRPLASSFDPAKLSLTSSLFLVMAPMIPLSAFNTTWRSILNTEGRFALPALFPAATPLACIAFLFRFGPAWGVYSLAAGTMAGCAIETLLLAWCMTMRGFPLMPRWWGATPELRLVGRQYAPVIAGMLLLGGAPIIDQAVAAMLGSGNVAALNYGTRFTIVLLAVGPSAVAAAILPHFSRQMITEDWSHVRHSLRSYAVIILTAVIPVIALLIAFSPFLVRLFFERGQFTAADTIVVTRIQRFSLLQIAPAIVMALTLRLISAMKANHLLLRTAALGAVLNLVLDLVLTRWVGIAGIALTTSIVQMVCLAYLWTRVHREHDLMAGIVSTRIAGTPDSPLSAEPIETRSPADH